MKFLIFNKDSGETVIDKLTAEEKRLFDGVDGQKKIKFAGRNLKIAKKQLKQKHISPYSRMTHILKATGK